MRIAWIGRVRYRRAWTIQEEIRRSILAGEPAEATLLLEHEPVITLGRGAVDAHVLLDDDELARRGIEKVASSRGGDVTYHGPGQLVAYPIVRLSSGVVAHVKAMAEAVADLASELGVRAWFRRDLPGVWTSDGKLASVGIHIRRRVAIHGVAMNVRLPADAFSSIVPCGLAGVRMLSLADLVASPLPSMEQLARRLGEALARRLGRPTDWLSSEASRALLSLGPSVE